MHFTFKATTCSELFPIKLTVITLPHAENFSERETTVCLKILYGISVVLRYIEVDDILIIYNESTTNIEDLFHCFNSLNPNLKFTLEKEAGRRIHFLDLTIHREHNKFSIDIYRKPIFTDAIIPNDSCHPVEQKLAAIHFLYNRLDNYHLPPDRRQNEVNMIQKILHNNGYSTPARPTTRNFNKHEPSSEKNHSGPDSPTTAKKQEL
jgi:hypothetical protein